MGSHFCKCSVFITSSSPHTRQNSTKTFSSSALSTWWQVLNVYLIKITNRWMMCLIRDGLKAYRSDLTQLKWTKQFPHFRNSFCCTHTTPCGIPSKHIKGGESQFIYQLMESLLSLWSKLLNIPAREKRFQVLHYLVTAPSQILSPHVVDLISYFLGNGINIYLPKSIVYFQRHLTIPYNNSHKDTKYFL